MTIFTTDNYTNTEYPISQRFVDKLIENDAFWEHKSSCPHCSAIEDEYYTCTDCWSEGGNTQFKITYLLTVLNDFKKNQVEKTCLKTNTVFDILNNSDFDSITLIYDDYRGIIFKQITDEYDIYNEVFSVNLIDIITYFKEGFKSE